MTSLKNKSIKAYAWTMGGLLISRGNSFILSIFLARLLSPEEFGLVGMAMVFIGISQVFIDVGFGSALIQNKENTNLTYSSVFYLNLFFGVVLTVLMYYLAPYIGNFYQNNEITKIVRWLSLIFVFGSLNQVQTNILKRELNYKLLTLRGAAGSIVSGVLGIIMAYKGFGVYALVIQSISGSFFGTVFLWSISGWRPDLRFSFFELRKLFSFSAFVFFDRLLSSIFQKLDVFLIGKIFSPAMLGYYTRAVSLKDQVTTYSTASLSKVFFPVLSSLQDDDKEYSRVFFKVLSVSTFVSYLLTGVLFILGKDIIILIFGPKWKESVPIFQVLIIAACNKPLNMLMINAFMSKGKSKANFLIGIIRKLIILIPLLVAYYTNIYYFTVTFVIASYFITILHVFFAKALLQLSLQKHFIKIFEGIVPVMLLITIDLFFNVKDLYPFISTIIFTTVYMTYSIVIKNEGLFFIFNNVKSKLFK